MATYFLFEFGIMSSDDTPVLEESEFKYEARPEAITLMIGGIIMGVVVFYAFRWALNLGGFDQFEIIPWLAAGALFLTTVKSSLVADTVITINTKSGWIYARDKHQFWEGYANELDRFLVLQREIRDPRGELHTNYKLYLELPDESKYEVEIDVLETVKVIEIIEQAKAAVPTTDVSSETMLYSESAN